MDFIRTEPIFFDAFLHFVSPLSSTRHVFKHKFAFKRLITVTVRVSLVKLRELSQVAVIDVVDDQADPFVGFEEAADHSRIVKNLSSPLN